jgi:cyanophycin synthetase
MIVLKSSRVLVGHTQYGDPPVVFLSLDLADVETSADKTHPGLRTLRDQIRPQPPGLVTIDTSGPVPAMAERFADIVLALMQTALHRCDRVLIESQPEPHAVNVVVSCEEPLTCLEAAAVTLRLINTVLVSDANQDTWKTERNNFLLFAKARRIDDNTRLLRLAARRRGLPVIDLEQDPFELALSAHGAPHGLIQIGQGIHQHRLRGSLPDRQPIPMPMLRDRRRLIPHLAASGVLLARHDTESTNCNRLSRALRAAARLGFPVTLKPAIRQDLAYRVNANGEFSALVSPEQLTLAFEVAAGNAHAVWVEESMPGDSYRFLVVGGQVRAVARRRPPTLNGDGILSLRELTQARAEQESAPVKRHAWQDLLIDDPDVALRLRLASLTWDSVLPAGQVLVLRAQGTPYNGGMCEDVTDRVPEAYRHLAEQAAACCDLAVLAGVDMVIRTIEDEAAYPNCVVTDVMPDPDLLTHCQPDVGTARAVDDALVEALFPDGQSGRIPIVAVTGTNGKTTTSRMIAHILRHAGLKVGLSTTVGAQVNDDMLVYGDLAGVPGAAFVLTDPGTEAAVLEVARGGLIKQGAPFDYCNVGVCLNVEADHIGLDGIETVDQMARVKSDVIKRAQDTAVLNADDPRVLAMAATTPAARIILVSAGIASKSVSAHLASGGEAILIEGEPGSEHIVWHAGDQVTHLLAAAAIPATHGGVVRFNTLNAAFAAAAACGMGLACSRVAEALACFKASVESNPERFNVHDGLPFKVIFDYAHNAHGLRALTEALSQWPVSGRRILVSRSPADRALEDIQAMALAVAGKFDLYICTNSMDLRGHAPTKVPEIFRATLRQAGIADAAIFAIPDRFDAVKAARRLVQPDDLLVIIAHKDIDKLITLLNPCSVDTPEDSTCPQGMPADQPG